MAEERWVDVEGVLWAPVRESPEVIHGFYHALAPNTDQNLVVFEAACGVPGKIFIRPRRPDDMKCEICEGKVEKLKAEAHLK